MLALNGPAVGFQTRTFKRKDGSQGAEHLLYVATASGAPVACVIPDETLRALGVDGLALRTMGTLVSVEVELAERWESGTKVPCVRAIQPPQIQASVNGEVPARAAD